MEVLQLLNVVAPEVRSISGTVSKDGTTDEAFTNGSVRYINPVVLRPFSSARASAQRMCRANGTKFLSGYAIADDRLDVVVQSLEVLAVEVNAAKHDLISKYDQYREEWEYLNPSITPWKSKFPTKAYIDKQCGMGVAIYKINPQNVLPVFSAIEDGVAAQINGMPLQIVREIAQDVSESWVTSSDRATQRIKGLLNRVRNKLRSLEFLGGNLKGIAQLVEDVLSRLPSTGPIEGADFVMLSGLLFSLADPQRMINDLSGLDSGLTVDDLWTKPDVAVVADVVAMEQEVDLLLPETEAPELLAAAETVLAMETIEGDPFAPAAVETTAEAEAMEDDPFAPAVTVAVVSTPEPVIAQVVEKPVVHVAIDLPAEDPVYVPELLVNRIATEIGADAWNW